jgi:hypothetical protein
MTDASTWVPALGVGLLVLYILVGWASVTFAESQRKPLTPAKADSSAQTSDSEAAHPPRVRRRVTLTEPQVMAPPEGHTQPPPVHTPGLDDAHAVTSHFGRKKSSRGITPPPKTAATRAAARARSHSPGSSRRARSPVRFSTDAGDSAASHHFFRKKSDRGLDASTDEAAVAAAAATEEPPQPSVSPSSSRKSSSSEHFSRKKSGRGLDAGSAEAAVAAANAAKRRQSAPAHQAETANAVTSHFGRKKSNRGLDAGSVEAAVAAAAAATEEPLQRSVSLSSSRKSSSSEHFGE